MTPQEKLDKHIEWLKEQYNYNTSLMRAASKKIDYDHHHSCRGTINEAHYQLTGKYL